MAAIMEQQQGVRQGRRRAKKTEFRWSKLLLLLCFFSYSESSPEGNTPRSVMGEEGGNATLSCQLVDRNIIKIDLIRFSKIILVCQNEECKSENDRVFKEGTCDAIIKDLRLSDAGKYILRVYNDEQTIMEQYHLHFKGEISVKTGEQLKMDVLLINADKVKKNSSGEWTEVWTRGHGVRSNRLTDSNETLTIKEFRANDTGTYRVLDSEGEILITVTVTESSTGSKEKLNTYAQHKSVIIVVSVIGVLLVLVLISALIWKHKCQKKNSEHESVPMEDMQ